MFKKYKKSIYNLLANLSAGFLLFLSFLFYARFLNASSFGVFQIEYLLFLFVPIVFLSFADYSLAYHIGASQDKKDESEFFSLSLNITYFLSFFYLLIIFSLKSFLLLKVFHIDNNLYPEAIKLFYFFALFFLLQVFINNVKSLMLGRGEIKERFILIFLHRFFLSFLSVLFLFLFKELYFVSLAYFLASFFALFYSIFYLKKIGITWKMIFPRQKAKKFFHYGKSGFLINLGTQSSDWLDTFLIAFFMSPDFVAFYAFAYNIFNQLIRIPKMISEPYLSEMIKADTEKSFYYYKKARNLLFLIQTPIFLVLFFYSLPILKIFYGKNLPLSAGVLKILSLVILFSPLWSLNMFFLARNKASLMARSILFSVLLNLILNLVLIPNFALNGAAWATFVSFLFFYILGYLNLKFKFKL